MKTKWCGQCETEMPIDRFSKNAKEKDGVRCYCRECHNKMNRIWVRENSATYREIRRVSNKSYEQQNQHRVKAMKIVDNAKRRKKDLPDLSPIE